MLENTDEKLDQLEEALEESPHTIAQKLWRSAEQWNAEYCGSEGRGWGRVVPNSKENQRDDGGEVGA